MTVVCDTCGADEPTLRDQCESKNTTWHTQGLCGSCSLAVTRLAADGRCFLCGYWLEQIDVEPETRVVVDGVHYRLGNERSQSRFRGYGGREFVIRFHDGREVTTTNLWHQGTIPEHLRDRLPDNAVFVPQPAQQVSFVDAVLAELMALPDEDEQ